MDIVKYYAGMTALELTDVFLPDGLESPAQFVILVEFLKKLAYKPINSKNLLIKLFYDTAIENGYSINLASCGRCGKEINEKVFLSVKDGYCVCEDCRKQGEGSFSVDTYKFIKKIASGDLTEESNLLANNGLKFFGYYFSKIAGINLKSLSVLIDISQ